MVALGPAILKLRGDRRILKLPPYASALCIIIGIAWLLILPLNDHSRQTYISENALLPGQVHTHFGGSEHNIFRAYRHEVAALSNQPGSVVAQSIGDIFKSQGLKVAQQKYSYLSASRTREGENVYGILRGPRADATEAIVLVAAWRNMDEVLNQSGVALVLTLARYLKRWSLWSKDIIFLITEDSTAGPQAWVDAYHDTHSPETVEGLSIKGGALQGAVVVDYTAGPGGRRFDKLHVFYDGVNGQLANLDLFNTVVNIANAQVGMGVTIQRMWNHKDSYKERLETVFRGMVSQGVGQASGPHSCFIPYHVDALTLQTVGDGPHDEMSLGRVVEGAVRSLNNLLEHLHQSFFFYLLMQPNRFVSIGTYLPSAMLIAVNFAITSIALWVFSGRPNIPEDSKMHRPEKTHGKTELSRRPTSSLKEPSPTIERHLFLPITFIGVAHFFGLIALKFSGQLSEQFLKIAFYCIGLLSLIMPHIIAAALSVLRPLTIQNAQLIICFSTLLLSISLATLSTLNFSLSLFVGLLASPISFIMPFSIHKNDDKSTSKSLNMVHNAKGRLMFSLLETIVMLAVAPTTVLAVAAYLQRTPNPFLDISNTSTATIAISQTSEKIAELLRQAAFGYNVSGTWTMLVVWLVWWPNWAIGAVLASPFLKLR